MNAIEYEKLMAEIIVPLDISTLTKLEADVARLLQHRQAGNPATRRPMMELVAMAREDLHGLDMEKYWAERERELEESRNSWAEREQELDMERRS